MIGLRLILATLLVCPGCLERHQAIGLYGGHDPGELLLNQSHSIVKPGSPDINATTLQVMPPIQESVMAPNGESATSSGTNLGSPDFDGQNLSYRIGKLSSDDSKTPYHFRRIAQGVVDVASFVGNAAGVPFPFAQGQAVMNAIEVAVTGNVQLRNLFSKLLDSLAVGIDFKYEECAHRKRKASNVNLLMCIGRIMAAVVRCLGEMRVVSSVAATQVSRFASPLASTFVKLAETSQRIYVSGDASGADLWDLAFGFARFAAFLGGGFIAGTVVNEVLNIADRQVLEAFVGVAQLFRETFFGTKLESQLWEWAWVDKDQVAIACGEKVIQIAEAGVSPDIMKKDRGVELAPGFNPPAMLFFSESAEKVAEALLALHSIANRDHQWMPHDRKLLFDVFLVQEQTVQFPDQAKRMYKADVLYGRYKDLWNNGCLVGDRIMLAATVMRGDIDTYTKQTWACRVTEEVCRNLELPHWLPRRCHQRYPATPEKAILLHDANNDGLAESLHIDGFDS